MFSACSPQPPFLFSSFPHGHADPVHGHRAFVRLWASLILFRIFGLYVVCVSYSVSIPDLVQKISIDLTHLISAHHGDSVNRLPEPLACPRQAASLPASSASQCQIAPLSPRRVSVTSSCILYFIIFLLCV